MCYFPHIKEQSNIAILLEKIDVIIDLQQEQLQLYERLKKSLLQKLFIETNDKLIPRLRFVGFDNDWKQYKLYDLGNSYSGLNGKSKADFGHGEAKYITYMNVFNNSIANTNKLDSIEIDNRQNEVRNGDILFTVSSETPEEVGMSSVWLGNENNVYLNSFCFGFSPTVKMDSYYLSFLFRIPMMRKKFMILAQGISRYNISKKRVLQLDLPLPSVDEQKIIGYSLNKLDIIINTKVKNVKKLKEIKKYLLQKLFI